MLCWLAFLCHYYGKKWVWQSLQTVYLFFQVIYKSYRQELTSIRNSLLLLKPEYFDKSRLPTFYKHTIQRTGSISIGETGISMTLNHRASTRQCLLLRRTWQFHFLAQLSFGIRCNFVIKHWYHTMAILIMTLLLSQHSSASSLVIQLASFFCYK